LARERRRHHGGERQYVLHRRSRSRAFATRGREEQRFGWRDLPGLTDSDISTLQESAAVG
jgi:hypothetical protein